MRDLTAVPDLPRRGSPPPRRTARRARSRTVGASITALAIAATSLVPLATTATAAEPGWVESPSQYVDPFVGTTNAGNTHPGAVAPFGMLAWGPDQSFYNGPTSGADAGKGTLRTASPSGYEYGRDTIRGFGLTHVSGAGCTGLSGDVPFFPVADELDVSPTAADAARRPYESGFSHDDESAAPGRYDVALDSGVDVSLAATTRAGSGEFTYPAGAPATMLVRTSDSLVGSSDADVTIDPETRTITGSVTSGNFCGPFTGDQILQHSYYTVHFVAQFDSDFAAWGTWEDDALEPGATDAQGGTGYTGGLDANGNAANGYPPAGKGSGAYVTFADGAGAGTQVGVRVGISYVSAENAAQNLATEIPDGTTHDEVALGTSDAWDAELSRASVAGGTDDERTTFYSALYHALLHPNVTSDVKGEYTGFDLATHEVPDGQDAQYATFSGWDVYRSQIQLLTLLDPDRGSDVAASLLAQANQNDGVWDRWTHNSGAVHVMAGDPSAIAVAAIRAFGGTDFPVEEAYDSLAQAARVPTDLDLSRRGWNVAVEGQRPSLDQFLEHGYYPEGCNAWGCANETLEMAAADHALATLASALGKDDDAAEFSARSQSWQNQFNPDATADGGYFQGRAADGTWTGGFDPASSNGFVEGTAAQYVWMVQHNPAGLFDAMGGRDAAVARLDGFFRDSSGAWRLTGSWDDNVHANMDNEPSIATPWLYNYAGVPSKTQETVRRTIEQLWLSSPDGVPNGPDGIPGNDDLGEMSSWLVFAAMGLYPQDPSQADLTVAAPLFPKVEVRRADGVTLSIDAPDAALGTPYITGMRVDGEATSRTFLPADAITHDTHVEYDLSATPDLTWGTGADDAPPSSRDGEQPYLASLSTARTQATPGGPTQAVTLTVHRFASSATEPVRYTVEAPDGLEPVTASGTVPVDEDGTGQVEITLRADRSLALGSYPVTVHLTSGDDVLADQSLQVDVVEQVSTLVSTGFEPGQPQAPANERLENTGFGDYCCSIGGVETKVQGGDARTGGQAVIYSARATQADAHASDVLLDVDTPVSGGETLRYWLRPQEDGGPFGDYVQDASRFAAVDLLFTDGTRLSDTGVQASNGAPLDALAQGGVLETDTWNEVAVVLPDEVGGRTVDKVLLTLSTGDVFATPGQQDGYLRGWVDDLSLTAPVPALEVTPATGVSVVPGDDGPVTLAHVTGGAGDSADDYTATMEWGDGSAPETVALAPGEDGYDVVTGHAYDASGSYAATVTVADADDVRVSSVVVVEVGESGVAVDVTASARCLAGTAFVAVRATNHDGDLVDVTLGTPYGSRVVSDVADGKNAYQSFSSRSTEIPAGTASVTVTASDGRQEVLTVAYDALSCG
ncbi:GH92 family glycosyl hydrolase [Cellulosimicrobium arenosum]|uniref:GH92 family glycosyl hydrolase n=1 Tax=Cellulosimicrobium arenosum TaxID=2708133 RepID=A0A927G6R1_9MICO|nr:GH92 family glycosyl hydrolase [Cellulosimicrobium arenosum]MBD8077956.1 GH92 family glycosyl hydrolase [Cellulosimicrobium arenosum]